MAATRRLAWIAYGAFVLAGCGGAVHSGASAPPPFHFLVVDQDAAGRLEIASVDAGRRRALSLLGVPPARSSRAAFSPDKRWIAFDSGRSLLAMRIDGTARRTVGRDEVAFSWSPDSRRLVYATRAGLFVVSRGGTSERRLQPASRYGDSEPQWSPDGRVIAFIHWTGPYGDMGEPPDGCVRTIRADGSGARSIACVGSPQWLAWSPDSMKIAVADNYEYSDITVLNLVGRPAKALSYGGDVVRALAWSPGSKLLAVNREYLYGPGGLSIVDTSGRTRMRRKDIPGRQSAPEHPAAWSADGRLVAVGACGRHGGCRIYTMSSSGGRLRDVARVGDRKGRARLDSIVVWAHSERR